MLDEEDCYNLLNLERTNQSKLIKKETEKNLNRAQFQALNL